MRHNSTNQFIQACIGRYYGLVGSQIVFHGNDLPRVTQDGIHCGFSYTPDGHLFSGVVSDDVGDQGTTSLLGRLGLRIACGNVHQTTRCGCSFFHPSALHPVCEIGPLLHPESPHVPDGCWKPRQICESVHRIHQVGHILILTDVNAALYPQKSEPGQCRTNVRIGGGNTLGVV